MARRCVGFASPVRAFARLGDYHVAEDLALGRLEVRVLPPAEGDSEDINAVFLGGLHIPHRLRLFLDFMVPRLQERLRDGAQTRPTAPPGRAWACLRPVRSAAPSAVPNSRRAAPSPKSSSL